MTWYWVTAYRVPIHERSRPARQSLLLSQTSCGVFIIINPFQVGILDVDLPWLQMNPKITAKTLDEYTSSTNKSKYIQLNGRRFR